MVALTHDPIATALIALKGDNPAAHVEALATLDPLILKLARKVARAYAEQLVDAEDVAQTVRLRLPAVAATYQYDPSRPAIALATVVVRRAAWTEGQRLARQRPRGTWSLDSQSWGRVGSGNYTIGEVLRDPHALDPADAAATDHDSRVALMIFAEELSDFERDVWFRVHVNDETYEEAAAALSTDTARTIDRRAIDNGLQRARKKFDRLQRVRRDREPEYRIDHRGESNRGNGS